MEQLQKKMNAEFDDKLKVRITVIYSNQCIGSYCFFNRIIQLQENVQEKQVIAMERYSKNSPTEINSCYHEQQVYCQFILNQFQYDKLNYKINNQWLFIQLPKKFKQVAYNFIFSLQQSFSIKIYYKMETLLLQDKNKEKVLHQIFEEIQNQLLEEDEDIISEIDKALIDLNQDDRNIVFQYLHSKFRNFSFFSKGNYGEQVDYIKIYHELKIQNKFEQIFQFLKNNEFCKMNHISIIIQENVAMVSKLGPKIIDLLDFNDLIKQQQVESNIHQLDFLKKLLNFLFFDGLNNDEQIILEQIIGSQLIYEVYKVQFYIETIKTRNPQAFLQFVAFLQQRQQKINQDSLIKLDKDLIFLINLFTQELKQSRENLKRFLLELLNLTDEQYFYKNIMIEIESYLTDGSDFQHLYFMVAWHFLISYAQRFEIADNQCEFSKKILQFPDINRKQRFIERMLIKSKTKNDEIYMFVMHRAIYFIDKTEDFLSLEHYQQYQKFQEKLNQRQQCLNFLTFHDLIFSPKPDFLRFWQLIRQLQYQNLRNEKYYANFQRMIIALWQMEIQEEIQLKFQEIFKLEKESIQACTKKIEGWFYKESIPFKTNLLKIASFVHSFDKNQLKLIIKIYQSMPSIKNINSLLKFQEKLLDRNRTIGQIIWFSQIQSNIWNLIKQCFLNSDLITLAHEVLEFYKNNIMKDFQILYNFFLKLFQVLNIEQDVKLKCFKILVMKVNHKLINILFFLNQKRQKQISTLKITLFTFYSLYDILSFEDSKIFYKCINYIIPNSCYNLELIFELQERGADSEMKNNFIKVHYYKSIHDEENLIKACFRIYSLNQKIYQEIFLRYNYLDVFQTTPFMLKKQQQDDYFPKNMNIKLEAFNISLAKVTEQQQKQTVKNWVRNTNNQENFFKLIPQFFNIIKRGESSSNFLTLILQEMNNNKKALLLNLKAIFQVLFNNSTSELQVMLMRFHSIQHPVPLIYQNPDYRNIKKEEDLYLLNHNLFHIFQNSYTIINFSLSKKISKIGKTHLINEIFYQTQKFEIKDSSDISSNTIDIMFDVCFNGTRNFAIADSHGLIPITILSKILPLFKLWIIQVNGSQELHESYKEILQLKRNVMVQNVKIIVIIRNQEDNFDEIYILEQFSEQQIKFYNILDLNQENLTELERKNTIYKAQQFIFAIINQQNPSENLVNQMDFFKVEKNFGNIEQQILLNQLEGRQIIKEIKKELIRFTKKVDGFYNLECFPIRGVEDKIKKANEQLRQNFQVTKNNKTITRESLKQEIERLEKSIQNQTLTKVLKMFCSLLEKQNYYILYITLIDKLRKFGEDVTSQHKQAIESIIAEIEKKKAIKKQMKEGSNAETDKDLLTLKIELYNLKERLKENNKNLQLKNIGIEIFWREIISQRQRCKDQFQNFDPLQKIYEMIQKGEPFEFLNGDQLSINSSFLQQLAEQFPQKGNEKVLVFSIIGPQSSGKSTILNKIFGCHFWTNVGRCTKGIYLQLLEVQNKQLFDNQFDYILLLDTEGLQNSNQTDTEFDKKMALFILAISDIIVINVKGDINIQFRKLIEMCVYTLGQMQNNFSFTKKLSWFFNQNNIVHEKEPFLNQIREISNNLNSELIDSEQQNYDELLCIKDDNIYILGSSAYVTKWNHEQSLNVEWRQMFHLDTFSLEAYCNGIKIIEGFIQQIKNQKITEKKHINTLNFFIQNITANWESIQKLPDLLEFTDLIQYQQDKFMKQEFDKLYNKEDLFAFTCEIKNKISQQIEKKSKKNIKIFSEIRENEEIESDKQFELIKNTLTEQLKQIKQINKIKKKLLEKYLKQLEQNIICKKCETRVFIFEEIKIHERQYQTTEGFAQIENFLASISSDSSKLERYQKDQALCIQTFDDLWSGIMKKLNEEKSKVFDEFQENWLQSIQQTNNKYFLRSNYDQQYLGFFSTLNKTDPFINTNENDQIFSIFEKELNQTQFLFIDKSEQRNQRYWDIFSLDIQRKIEKSTSSDLLDICKYFSYQISWQIIDKLKLVKYLNSDFFKDLAKAIQQGRFQKKLQVFLNQFFNILDFFQIQYDEQAKIKLKQTILNPNGLFNFFQSNIQDVYEKFQKSFKFNDKQPIFIEKNIDFQSNFSQLYSNLEIENMSYVFKNLKEMKEKQISLLKQYIILSESFKIKPVEESALTYFIQNPQNHCYDSRLPQIFFDEMKTQGGWRKLYFKVYDLIKEEFKNIFCRVIQQNQFNNTDDENFTISNSLIQQIMQQIQTQIDEFNKQFAVFGFLLRDVGVRLIYYYSILIIWRFGCYKKWNQLSISWKQDKDKANEFEKFMAEITKNKVQQSILKAKTLVDNILKIFIDQFCKENSGKAIQEVQVYEFSCEGIVKHLDSILLEGFSDESINVEQIVDYNDC